MGVNRKIVINTIMQECKRIEERCNGYREEILDTVSDIINEERLHAIAGTNIKQKIADKCNATGSFLAKNRKPKNN